MLFYSGNYSCSQSVHKVRKWVSGLAMNLNDETEKKLVLEDMIAKDLFGNLMKRTKMVKMNWD